MTAARNWSVPATLATAGGTFRLRRAVADDVPAVVALLADDALGAARDGGPGADPPSPLAPYLRGFAAVDADPAHLLAVVTAPAAAGERVVGTMQLTLLPGLARRGALRMHVEAVRTHREVRGRGLGEAMLRWAVEEARRQECALVQLTSDKRRPDAHRFYARLGFVASHEGFKLAL